MRKSGESLWNAASQMEESPSVDFGVGEQLGLLKPLSNAGKILMNVDIRELSPSELRAKAREAGIVEVDLKRYRAALRFKDCSPVDTEDTDSMRRVLLYCHGDIQVRAGTDGYLPISEIDSEAVAWAYRYRKNSSSNHIGSFEAKHGINQ